MYYPKFWAGILYTIPNVSWGIVHYLRACIGMFWAKVRGRGQDLGYKGIIVS